MQTTLSQFYPHLQKDSLRQIYIISSDVTLLQQEARDALRAKARDNDYKQYEQHSVSTGFNWYDFFISIQNYSLFSKKTFVELSIRSVKIDDKATKNLLHYLENPASDKILLILTNKLTSNQLKTKWYKAINKQGVCLSIPALTKQGLPRWIIERAKTFNLNLTQEAVTLLAQQTEGNLTASLQALYKLNLLYPNSLIEAPKIIEIVSNNARYHVFDLANLMLSGNTREALRCLLGLKNTGVDPTLVLWSITREIRSCLKLRFQHDKGATLQTLLQSEWQSRRNLLKQALARLTVKSLQSLLLNAEKTDHIIKGLQAGNAWNAAESLVIDFCGQKVINHPRA